MKKNTYREPSIVHLGTADELIKLNINGDICDGTPCTGNYRYFYAAEKGKSLGEIAPDHVHDPQKPLTPAAPPSLEN